MDRRKFLKDAAQTAAVSVAAITGRTQSVDAQEASDDDHDHPPVPPHLAIIINQRPDPIPFIRNNLDSSSGATNYRKEKYPG